MDKRYNICAILTTILLLAMPLGYAAPWHRDCKIWRMEGDLVGFSELEKLAIREFVIHTKKQVQIAEICTVSDDENEIFFVFEKNVSIPPMPGSSTSIIVKKNEAHTIEIFDGK